MKTGFCRISDLTGIFAFILLCLTFPASALTTSAWKDQTCVGYRSGHTTCTAGEFVVSPVFSAEPGTPPFCTAGQAFNFKVQLDLSGTNTDRMDIGFFVGQIGNDPRDPTPGNNCSVATFPKSPSPWIDNDSDSCGDFLGGGVQTTTINEIKVVCVGDSTTGELTIPYVLSYWQNNGNMCTGPGDVQNGAPSKCNAGTSKISGVVAVRVGAYVEVTKATLPAGNSTQPFTYTAVGPPGSKVIALVGSTYTPASISDATNTASATITGGQTVRFYIDATSSNKTLTITEAAAPGWEAAAESISCAPVTGNPSVTADPATRTITANNLTLTNSAAACMFTNKQSARITLVKTVDARADSADQFTVSASGGGTLVGTTSATTSGAATSASTTFYSSPSAVLTLTDAKAAGPTPLANYDARLTCTNALSGSSGHTANSALPNQLSTTSAGITPLPGDDITCTYTSTIVNANISGTVFKDSGSGGGSANNGLQDGIEAGIFGATVKLTDCNGATYGSAATDGAGRYTLSAFGVAPGTVCVEESNLASYTSTGANVDGNVAPVGYTLLNADKIRFTLATHTDYAGLNFGDVPANQFITDGAKTGIAGSTLFYPHTFIAGSGGTVTFSLPGATASPAIAGWSEQLYLDSDCNAALDGNEGNNVLPSAAITVVEAQAVCLIQKEFIPAGAAQGASNQAPVQASFAYTGSSLPNTVYTRQDITIVSSASLLLQKEVRNVTTNGPWTTRNTAKPGEILEYRITYTNNGPEPIQNLQINDATLAFTTFVSGLCDPPIAATPASLGGCTLTKTLTNNTGGLKWTFAATPPPSLLQPGGAGFVTYQVKVD